MSQYTIFQGSDTKFYIRTHKDGAGATPTAPTDTLSSGFNTLALAQANMIASIQQECNYSEVAF
jgi:hypothetical protein